MRKKPLKNGDRVVVISDCNSYGEHGKIIDDSCSASMYYKHVKVRLDNGKSSNYNIGSLIHENEYNDKGYKEQEVDIMMKDYKYVARVHLMEDTYKKDYYFALYPGDVERVCEFKPSFEGKEIDAMVIVNAKGDDKRQIAFVKEVIPAIDYGKNVTAQVVGVVDMGSYYKRKHKESVVAEIEKQKAVIEAALQAEIAKRKTIEYYEKIAKEYPEIEDMVKNLKVLEEEKDKVITHG